MFAKCSKAERSAALGAALILQVTVDVIVHADDRDFAHVDDYVHGYEGKRRIQPAQAFIQESKSLVQPAEHVSALQPARQVEASLVQASAQFSAPLLALVPEPAAPLTELLLLLVSSSPHAVAKSAAVIARAAVRRVSDCIVEHPFSRTS
jgi:hypothetical protein